MPDSDLPPGLRAALGYADDVLSGAIPARRLVKLAARRFLDDLGEARAGRGAWAFRADLAEIAGLRIEAAAALGDKSAGPQRGPSHEWGPQHSSPGEIQIRRTNQ